MLDTTYFSGIIRTKGGDVMGEQERIRILELAYEITELKSPRKTGNITEASIKEWHKLFDQAYKAILQTALGK